MSEKGSNREELKGKVGFKIASFEVKRVEVIPPNSIEVEKSATLRYLGTANGHLPVYSRVFVTMYGFRHEITRDDLPEAPSPA